MHIPKSFAKLSLSLLSMTLLVQGPALAVASSATTSSKTVKTTTTTTTTTTETDVNASRTKPSVSGRPTVCLALGGGGTRGAAHVGVLKVLQQNHIPIDFIVGTSMGAIVGGLYSAGMPIDELDRRFRDASLMKSFMTVPIQLRIAVAPIMFIPRLFGSKAYDGLYKGNKFRKYLLKSVPVSEHDISELKIPFRAVVLNVVDGRVYALDKGNLGYALQASSAVPALRKPVQIGNQLFVDGGTAENVPVEQALKTGADIIIAVNVDEDFNELPLEAFRKPGSMGKRMLTWDLWDSDSKLCAKANVTIKPQVTGIGLISRSKKEGIQALEAGEVAAQAKIPEIKKCLAEHGLSI